MFCVSVCGCTCAHEAREKNQVSFSTALYLISLRLGLSLNTKLAFFQLGWKANKPQQPSLLLPQCRGYQHGLGLHSACSTGAEIQTLVPMLEQQVLFTSEPPLWPLLLCFLETGS